ncbi:MAG: YraN family protein [Candidatus Omnitrophica bacterium]|nr:YraN family protein [Candidatus Omnitrophota bacterium]MBU4140619.1 YraN family protein [Candidatus Omnitrophota bacterium]
MHRYKQDLGAKGEGLALQFLRRRGYKIITRNFSCRFGEIDIIARQGKATVFVEVKTRSSCGFGLPQDSVRRDKIKHLLRCAQFYIKNYADPEGNFRFDVVAIVLGDTSRINLIKNAF